MVGNTSCVKPYLGFSLSSLGTTVSAFYSILYVLVEVVPLSEGKDSLLANDHVGK